MNGHTLNGAGHDLPRVSVVDVSRLVRPADVARAHTQLDASLRPVVDLHAVHAALGHFEAVLSAIAALRRLGLAALLLGNLRHTRHSK